MRKFVTRGMIVVVIAMAVAVQAEAKSRDGNRWFERNLDPIVKLIRKFVMKSTGDGLSDPWPKP